MLNFYSIIVLNMPCELIIVLNMKVLRSIARQTRNVHLRRHTIADAINAFVVIAVNPQAEFRAALLRPPNRLRRRASIAVDRQAAQQNQGNVIVGAIGPNHPNPFAISSTTATIATTSIRNRRMSVADFRPISYVVPVVPILPFESEPDQPVEPMEISNASNASVQSVEMQDPTEQAEPMDIDE